MMRRTSVFLMGVAAGAIVAVGVSQPRLLLEPGKAVAAASDTYRQLNLFGDVFERVRADYIEKPEDSKLIEAAINGMLSSLDPHSAYLDLKEYRDMQVNTRGQFGGLGIEVTMEDGLVKVVAPMDETPAAKAGIQAGDLIAKLDGEDVKGMTLSQAVEKMRGAVATPIKITVIRKGEDKPLEFTLVRDLISLNTVRSRVEGEDIGYIRISQFADPTSDGLKKAIADLTAKIGEDKLKGFIIDLRNNPGGVLPQAIEVSDVFLDRGEIVSTRGRDPNSTERYNARPGDLVKGKPVIVLVNGGSASASEIVAGALQDHKRATILGSLSFGKASVQSVIPVSGNAAIKLTTARYYTPSGRSIQAKGIQPDIELIQDVPKDVKEKAEAAGIETTRGEASLKGHLKNGEDEKTGSPAYVPPDPKDDTQLQLAIDLMHGVQKNAAYPADPKAAVPN
ncbi:S41 family peptidase [Ancylobacter sp. A5.8]|uniref:S41 family peptidase n=1 Tax=Ancylobacter gelatini TaxID=2919920 RepID=UPI001F4E1C8A|nr:S41 family peptidase [Ancylobacter gelatini]MCJ8144369.1 S41 family peptidase [Ancylobacter gelatini]